MTFVVNKIHWRRKKKLWNQIYFSLIAFTPGNQSQSKFHATKQKKKRMKNEQKMIFREKQESVTNKKDNFITFWSTISQSKPPLLTITNLSLSLKLLLPSSSWNGGKYKQSLWSPQFSLVATLNFGAVFFIKLPIFLDEWPWRDVQMMENIDKRTEIKTKRLQINCKMCNRSRLTVSPKRYLCLISNTWLSKFNWKSLFTSEMQNGFWLLCTYLW